MTLRVLPSVLIVIVSLGFAGCRQTDGPMPTAEGEVPNRLVDISRDLMSVSRGDTQARQDLADDLRVFVTNREAVPAADELARRTSDVVAGKTLDDQNAERLAHHLWTAAAARDISQRQVESLQNDLHALLVSMGVPEDNALNVASQAGEVQRLVTTRERRWYEFY
jgi:type IV pilus biogenesis protein CpaD/CtpE